MTKLSSSLGIEIHKVGVVCITIERISKKVVLLNNVNSLFFLEIDLIKNIFSKFGEMIKFLPDNSTKSIMIHFESEMSVHDILTIPEDTVETVKIAPLTIDSIRESRDSKYIPDVDGFIDNAEAVLSKYYEELRKPVEKQVDDGWTVISKKRKVKMQDIVPNQEDEKEEQFDDDDEEIDSDTC